MVRTEFCASAEGHLCDRNYIPSLQHFNRRIRNGNLPRCSRSGTRSQFLRIDRGHFSDDGLTGCYVSGGLRRRCPEVGFGEVWNILGSVVIGSRRLRQASGCRSFFFSPSILGNDNVLYHSLFGLVSPRVRRVDYCNQSNREFISGFLRISLELGWGVPISVSGPRGRSAQTWQVPLMDNCS